MLTADITNIQHFNVHDGPGIRTIVFFQGCPLKCKWCQNPEAISMTRRIMYNQELCIGCGACVESCPNQAIAWKAGRLFTDQDKCKLCGKCVENCYTLARTMSSKNMTLDEVYKEVMKDETSYRKSEGGVTVSGGEPLLRIDFIEALFQKMKDAGINTAIETAGYVPWERIERIASLTDTFLFDLKMVDLEKSLYWTGVDNGRIKHNIRRVCEIHDNVVIRIPLIPGVNDSDEEFGRMMEFVSSLRHINSVHILPFHNFGANKYSLLGDRYEMESVSVENETRVQACLRIAGKQGIKVNLGGTGFLEDRTRMTIRQKKSAG